MVNLSTKYLGLELKNPLIIGSCGLTNSLSEIKELQEKGAAAVLKSVFEEEIMLEYRQELKKVSHDESNLEYFDYLDYQIKEDNIKKYIGLIQSCKREINIPIIASINCKSNTEWTFFAKKIEQAGADALELNVFILPSDLDRSSDETEKIYFKIIGKVLKEVRIPVAIKISYYFSNLASIIKKFSESGIKGLVLFNRFYSPDIDIDNKKIISSHVLGSPDEISVSLRWIGMMSKRVGVGCDLAASTGVHDGKGLIKQLLAGANAVQVVSTLYKNGTDRITEMLTELETWMQQNNYKSISDFRGMLSQSESKNPALYERVQFMKYYSEMKAER
jgi:dihydroorotate dehydrogenase (fumarate)